MLPRLNNNDNDVIAYFHSFERIWMMRDIPREDWPSYLPSKRLRQTCKRDLDNLHASQYTLCPPKRPPFYFSNNSVKNKQILMIFGG